MRVYDQALAELQLEPQAAAFWRLDEDGFGKGAKDRRRRHDATAVGVTSVKEPGVGRCAELSGGQQVRNLLADTSATADGVDEG